MEIYCIDRYVITARENKEPPMSAEENRKIVEQFYSASNRGDMDTCFDLIADDIKWTNIGSTSLSGTYHGKAELQEKLLDHQNPKWKIRGSD